MADSSPIWSIPRGATFAFFQHPESFSQYAQAYYLAAKILWSKAPKGHANVPRPDYLVLPVLYLLHQYAELQLKEIIHVCHSIGQMSDAGTREVPTGREGHNLVRLFEAAEANFSSLSPSEKFPISTESREIIEDLGTFGSWGEALRYPTKRDGAPSMPSRYAFDIPTVMDRMQKAWKELGGLESYLLEWEQALWESRHGL